MPPPAPSPPSPHLPLHHPNATLARISFERPRAAGVTRYAAPATIDGVTADAGHPHGQWTLVCHLPPHDEPCRDFLGQVQFLSDEAPELEVGDRLQLFEGSLRTARVWVLALPLSTPLPAPLVDAP